MILSQDSVEIQGVFSAPDGIRMASIEFGRGVDPGEWYVVQSWNDLMIQSIQPLGILPSLAWGFPILQTRTRRL